MNAPATPTKILVIEDQTVMRENLVTLLEFEGFAVGSAANGRQGLLLAQAAPPDLVLCDVMMPDLDGYGVLEQLRREPATRQVLFIFLTAKGERADIRSGMNLGADDYLVKPVTHAELLEAIAARLERQRVVDLQRDRSPDFRSALPLEALGLTPREAEVLLWVAQGKERGDRQTPPPAYLPETRRRDPHRRRPPGHRDAERRGGIISQGLHRHRAWSQDSRS